MKSTNNVDEIEQPDVTDTSGLLSYEAAYITIIRLGLWDRGGYYKFEDDSYRIRACGTHLRKIFGDY